MGVVYNNNIYPPPPNSNNYSVVTVFTIWSTALAIVDKLCSILYIAIYLYAESDMTIDFMVIIKSP